MTNDPRPPSQWPRKTVLIHRKPGTPFLIGWYYADVFLGPIPLIKLVLLLLTLILIGVWR